MNKKLIKIGIGILFNLVGAYLLFMPYNASNFQSFPYFSISFVKVVGAIGLLFSYLIFYLKESSENTVNTTGD